MHWRTTNSKSIIRIFILFWIFGTYYATAQDVTPEAADDTLIAQASAVTDSVKKPSNFQRYKIDGVAAVVGQYLVLESDIAKTRIDIQTRMTDEADITDCQLVGLLMENKLFSHAAQLDSVVNSTVTDAQVMSQVDQQMSQLMQHFGSIDKLLTYYRKNSEKELRDELYKIDREMQLAEAMQRHITDEVEITPEEVRKFFDDIPEDERPFFSDEVEIAEIVIKPQIPQSEIDRVVNQLNEIRDDIIDNGASFNTKAVLYSEDGTSANGGKMTITRKDPLDKDFKEIAFSLREGEVSMPFKSAFGYHIIQVDKVLGQKRDIRHIILIPKPLSESLAEGRDRLDSLRTRIENGEISFADAAKKYSEEEMTKGNGGKLFNPMSGDTRFEMTKIDPRMYSEVRRLKEGEISRVLSDQDRLGKTYYKIISVIAFYPEHKADYAKDYTRIKDLALQNKQMKAIAEWRKKEIEETYIKINGDYRDCEFQANWLKN